MLVLYHMCNEVIVLFEKKSKNKNYLVFSSVVQIMVELNKLIANWCV